jgi:hypothetical protein
MDPTVFLFIILMASIFWLLLVAIPAWLMKRAIEQVVGIFRAHRANEPSTAKSVDDLGLRTPGFFDRIGRTRDYKPIALNLLLAMGVIQSAVDGRVYLSERKLKYFCERHAGGKPQFCEEEVPTPR